MNKALLCAAGIATLLTGCTTLPTEKEIDEADSVDGDNLPG